MNELKDFHTGLYDCEVNLTECANLFLWHSEIPELSPEKKQLLVNSGRMSSTSSDFSVKKTNHPAMMDLL